MTFLDSSSHRQSMSLGGDDDLEVLKPARRRSFSSSEEIPLDFDLGVFGGKPRFSTKQLELLLCSLPSPPMLPQHLEFGTLTGNEERFSTKNIDLLCSPPNAHMHHHLRRNSEEELQLMKYWSLPVTERAKQEGWSIPTKDIEFQGLLFSTCCSLRCSSKGFV
jgi:hypothetical protein